MAFGFGEVISTVVVIKMVATPFWNEYKKRKGTILKILQRSQMESLKNLSQALGELVARGKNKGIDSYELYRNLEKLLSLLCLDASHQYVSARLLELRANIMEEWVEKMGFLKGQDIILNLNNPWRLLRMAHRAQSDVGSSLHRAMTKLFQWDPEYAEVFESTKVDFKGPKADMDMEAVVEMKRLKFAFSLSGFILDRDLPVAAKEDRARAEREFRKWVEGRFSLAKAIHDTRREFAAALCESDALHSSYNPTHQKKAFRKAREAEGLREKLVELSNRGSFIFSGIPDSIAVYFLALLVCRFKTDRALGRKTEIAVLFDAVGATGAEREEIESHIGSFYGAVRRCWLKADWIKTTKIDSNPFSDSRGWRKEKSKLRVRFLEHYDLFQLKSPRQLTEEGVLGIVQTMEREEDIVFVRESLLNSELEKIYNRAAENVRHGKSDEAIADFKVLLRRASKGADIPVDMLSQIRLHLAYLYADCGENLEEAVGLARRTLEIQDTLFTRLVLGWIYYQQGKVVEAIEELERVKAARRDLVLVFLPLVLRVLGDAYRDAERHQDAEQAWQAGWELANDPEWTEQKGLTPFEVAERVGLRKALSERLG